jgi:hypothetical protein
MASNETMTETGTPAGAGRRVLPTGIPTRYAAINFRSRLEAKWAAFFDACGWRWQYEPLDLDGWIPDFAIGWKPTLVEVKPFFHAHQFDDALAKVIGSGHRDPVVLLGAGPRLVDDELALGWLAEPWSNESNEWLLLDLHIGYTEGNGQLGLCPMDGGWRNVIWEPPSGLSHPNKWARVSDRPDYPGRGPARLTVDRHWATACNWSQWKR